MIESVFISEALRWAAKQSRRPEQHVAQAQLSLALTHNLPAASCLVLTGKPTSHPCSISRTDWKSWTH